MSETTPARRRSRRGRIIVVSVLVLALLAPAVAQGWTLRRYLSGQTTAGATIDAITDSALSREYNSAYHSTSDGWRVRYYDTSNNITWQVESYSSPTSQGQTTGSRYAYCQLLDPNTSNTAYNCDTTVP